MVRQIDGLKPVRRGGGWDARWRSDSLKGRGGVGCLMDGQKPETRGRRGTPDGQIKT